MANIGRAAVTAGLFFVLIVYGCGSDGSKEAQSIMKKQADIAENYVNGLDEAKNAKDVVNVIEQYTEGMKELLPEIKKFNEQYPEYQQGKVPPGMEEDAKRLEEISAKIPGVMMKIGSYMMDSEVQTAMAKMGEEMKQLQ